MKPLSPGKYYLENKKKFFTLFIILVLSVALVSFVTSLITAVSLESSHTNLDPLKKMSLIMPSSNEIFIKDSVYDEITNYGEVKYAIKASISNTSFQSIVGNTSSPVVMLDNPNEDLNTVMQEMGFKLKGNLFDNSNSEPQIIMHEKLLLNKNLKIGDYIGNDVDESEWIFGKYKIVGSFTGEGIISIANQNIYYEVLKNEQGAGFDKPTGLVVFPKENRLDAMNSKIESFSRKDCDYITYNTLKKQFDEELTSYNTIMTIIIIVVVAVISISIGAMVYIIYMNRSEEFGILYAMGYKKTFIYKLIFAEIAIVSVISWALGYLLSYGMFALINLFLSSKGISLYFFSANGFINTLIVPIMVTIFSTIPVLRKLKKWDPVSIIEKR